MSIQVLSIVGWRHSLPLRLLSALALALVAILPLSGVTEARAETRTLKLYFIHTKERAEITYKRNGRYIQSGLNEINRFLRDWRQNEPTKMSPELMDVLWETYQTVRARDYIHVVSAYRSPKTNTMLRSRSKGVAQKSQHTLGRAIDFYIPGVPLKTLRDAGLKMGGGGVGYYPRSGSPFVHLDVGNVRHWPRMSRGELVSVFPNGRTLHVPSDGKPLPGYDQAMAAYQARKKGGGSSVQIASTGGSSSASTPRRSGGLLATLFGGGVDEEEDGNAAVAFAREPEPTQRGGNRPQRNQPAQQRDNRGEPLPGVQSAPVVAAPAAPRAPVAAPAPAEPEIQTPEQIIAALEPRAVPLPEFAPRPKADVAPVAVAAAPAPPANTLDAQAQAIASALASPAEVPASARETIIAGVPVPSSRPGGDRAGEAVVADAALGEAAANEESDAAAEIRRSAIAAIIAKASRQQTDLAAFKADDEVVLAAFAPVPERRPASSGSGSPLAELVAAMPQLRPDVVLPQEIRAGVMTTLKGGRVVASAASPDAAELAKKALTDRQPTGSIVKTTPKAAKPGPSDQKADRKPIVIPVEEVASRWALETAGRVTRAIASAKEPSLAYNAIRTAPKQVYTAGFAPVEAEPDPARFSGNAVTFLGVARFDTN